MSEFLNTIDMIGDQLVAELIVSREISSFSDDILTEIASGSFYGSKKLTYVDLPNVIKLGTGVFNNCSGLQVVKLPKVSSGVNFYGCYSLVTVDLSNVTSLIGAFSNCSSLAVVDLPKVTSLDGQVFYSCRALTKLILRNETLCSLNSTPSSAFYNCPFYTSKGYAYVPRALITAYQTATNWSVIYTAGTCEFLPLEDYTVDGTITGELDLDKLNGGVV